MFYCPCSKIFVLYTVIDINVKLSGKIPKEWVSFRHMREREQIKCFVSDGGFFDYSSNKEVSRKDGRE